MCIQGWHVGGLKLATAGVSAPWESANTTNQGSFPQKASLPAYPASTGTQEKDFCPKHTKLRVWILKLDLDLPDEAGELLTFLTGFPLTRSNINTITSQGCYMD